MWAAATSAAATPPSTLWISMKSGNVASFCGSNRLRTVTRGRRPRTETGSAVPLLVVGEERAEELVEGRLVAARDGRCRERAHRRGARDVHGERDLAEILARPQHRARPDLALVAHDEQAAEDDVEAVALL